MKETIEFKKDIIFKSTINEITDINLEHNYKVLDDIIEGEFLLDGTYKMNEASITKEEFYYNIPFSIAISDRIDKDSVNLNIIDFLYDYNKDVLNINIKLEMNYIENNPIEEIIEEYVEDRKGELVEDTMEELEIPKETLDFELPQEEENVIPEELDKNKIKELSKNFNEKETFSSYKIYKIKEEDTLESICKKYNIEEKIIRDINKIENISLGDKIIVPVEKND